MKYRRRSLSILLGSLLFGFGVVHAGEVKESETGVSFPETRRWGTFDMMCVGTGVREKWMVDVYAAALYIEGKSGKEALTNFLSSEKAKGAYQNGKLDVESLSKNEDFFNWLINSDLPITIDLTFVRDVELNKVKDANREALEPHLKGSPVLEQFLSLAQSDMKKFKHVTLNLMPKGTVVFQYMGTTHKPIVSPELKRALLHTYVGKNPISKSLKRNLVKRIDQLLK